MASRGYLSRRSKKANSSSQKSSVKGQRKKKLPPWDSTISDLLVYKPTKEELRRRHELHQPVQRFLESPDGTAPGSEIETFKTPENMRDARYSVLREIMNTNEKLQEALTYSDKKMSAVPDLFGDDPKKYRGFPNITCAPGHRRENDSETVRKLAFMKEPSVGASNLDILSDTVMDGTALNDLSELLQNTDENNNEQSLPSNWQSKHDPVNTSSTMQNSCSSSTSSTLLAGAPERQNEGKKRILENCDVQTEEKIFHETKIRKEDQGKKAPGKLPPTAPALKGLYDLREMIDNLEEEVRMLEQETGREQTSMSFVTKEKESFGGFTVSILHAITKLVGYLRDCENQRKTDLTLKQDIFLTLQQQQMLIDALTNEVICLQDENRKLRDEMETSKERTEEGMKLIKREMYAVLKSREYETLSSDMAFLYDRQTSETGNSQGPLQDVVRSHGIHDNFEYLSASEDGFRKLSEQTTSKNQDNSVKTNPATNNTVVHEETTPRTSLQSKTTPPWGSFASNIDSSQNSQITGPSDRIPQFDEQQKTENTSTSVNNQHSVPHTVETSPVHNQPLQFETCTVDSAENFPVNYQPPLSERKSSHNTSDLITPGSTSTSGVFTYYNPVVTNALGNENPTSLMSRASDKYVHDDLQRASVFIGRNQTTSPHRRSKQGEENVHSISRTDSSLTSDVKPASQSKISPEISPVLFDRKLLPERSGQERVVVRLPSMWQDYDAGYEVPIVQRNTPTATLNKQAVKQFQKSENGWFALSSHVESR